MEFPVLAKTVINSLMSVTVFDDGENNLILHSLLVRHVPVGSKGEQKNFVLLPITHFCAKAISVY